MSRGHGSAQRFVLEQLAALTPADPRWMRVRTIASRRRPDGGKPTRAELETIARAARRLAAAGLVDLGYVVAGELDEHGVATGKISLKPGKGELTIRATPNG
jgi:hypothetical protein